MDDKIDEFNSVPKSFNFSELKIVTIAIPILLVCLYFKFLYFLLMLAIIFFSHNEFEVIQQNILNFIFKDYHSEIIYKTLLSSPLTSFKFMLCPTILYFFNQGEFFAFALPILMIEINRVHNFILIYRVLNTNETNFKYLLGTTEKVDKSDPFRAIEKLTNPIKQAIEKENLNYKNKDENCNKEIKHFDFLKKVDTKHKDSIKIEEDKKDISNRKRGSGGNTSLNMFICCLIILILDIIYFVVYVYPFCMGIKIYNTDHGFTYILFAILVSFLFNKGTQIFDFLLGKRLFGHPITQTRTIEGIYGGIVTSLCSAYFIRYLTFSYFEIEIINGEFRFFFCSSFIILASLIGDFFESFLKRCADVEKSGIILRGYGGMLDMICSFTLGMFVIFYFTSIDTIQ